MTLRPGDALGALAPDLLDSLDAHVAVLDARGAIVAVNEAWSRFARDNGARQAAVGSSYLAACEAGAAGGDEHAGAMLEGLRRLLRGEAGRFAMEYPCDSPGTKRWFAATVTRFLHGGEAYLAAVHEDVTARKAAQDAVLEGEARLGKVLEALPVGVWIMDAAGTIVQGNTAGVRIWAGARYVGPERFGEYKGWWLDSGKPIAAHEWAAARAIRKGEISIDEEIRIECFDGTSKVILNSALPLRDASGRVSGAVIVNQDITARRKSQEALEAANTAIDAVNRELQQVLGREQQKARTDDLTGLCNRRHFFELAEQLFAVSRRYDTRLAMVMFDLDHFKQVNDRFGHLAGDAILQCVARVARAHARAADVLARYGGEEFVLALPNTDAAEALAVAEKLRAAVAACSEIGTLGVGAVTISAGIAERAAGDDTLEHVIHRADEALYEAKRAGRDRSRVLAPA